MEIIRDLREYVPDKASVVGIGMFDGVHTGHKALLRKIAEVASLSANKSIVISFDPHPKQILSGKQKQIRFLTSPKEKFRMIEETGINCFCLIPFTDTLSRQTYKAFFEDLLIKRLKSKHMVISSLQTIGMGRSGDLQKIKDLAKNNSCDLTVVEPVLTRERIISSSLIRILISDGNIEDANILLGYEYAISGIVIRGHQIGKLIGFPTVNLMIDYPDKLIPANGVYACRIEYNGKEYLGMGNIGFRPTLLNFGSLSVEAHIFDFNQDIYNEQVTIKFVNRIRDEQKFGSLQLLKQQLSFDMRQVLNYFQRSFIS